jgi:hypothetical protein
MCRALHCLTHLTLYVRIGFHWCAPVQNALVGDLIFFI